MYWYMEVLNKYAVFSGRARRSEYWMFTLFNVMIIISLRFIEGIAGIAPDIEESVLATMYQLVVFIPHLAVSVRRLHDTGRSGWWLLIGLIPIAGAIVLLVFFVLDSDRGANQYGDDPKQAMVSSGFTHYR